jgi:hypothetical protein
VEESEMRSETAKDLLAEADRARSKARADRRGAWFALSVFGALVLAAAPLYIAREVATYADGSSSWVSGGWWVSLYWLIAVPLGYLACVRFYRRHAERTGVAEAVWPWVATGLGLFALMAFVPPGVAAGWIPAFATGWTSLPLLALAGGFLVLAWLERNRYLAALSIVLFVLPGVCERIYNTFLAWRGFSGIGFSMLVVGVILLCAGALGWMSEGRER